MWSAALWNSRSLIAKRIFLTCVGFAAALALLGAYLAIKPLIILELDQRILRSELLAAQKRLANYQNPTAKIAGNHTITQRGEKNEKPRFDPCKPYKVIPSCPPTTDDRDSSRNPAGNPDAPEFNPCEPYEVEPACNADETNQERDRQIIACVTSVLDDEKGTQTFTCNTEVETYLNSKIVNGVRSINRYDYFEIILACSLFIPLVMLLLGRLWFLWVFVDYPK